MTGTVLIVSHRHGFEADPVIDRLRRGNVFVFRFNLNPEVEGTEVSIGFNPEGCWDGALHCDGRAVTNHEIGAAWFQQAPSPTQLVADESARLRRDNLFAAAYGFFDILCCPWLNSPSATLRAANKVRQLRSAIACGLAIPQTLVSNVPQHIRSFCAEKSESIAKNLATPWIDKDRDPQSYAAYTRRVQKHWLTNDAELAFAPVIYQELLDRVHDVRVVVAGGHVFPAAIEADQGEDPYDIRRGLEVPGNFEKVTISNDIEYGLLKLLRHFDLEHCSADFVHTRDNGLIFLELNVTGSWWWIDELYGGRICEGLCRDLVSKLK